MTITAQTKTITAACALPGHDPEMWYADEPEIRAEAKAICAGCPMRQKCYDTAVETEQEWGVWGGADFGGEPSYCKRGHNQAEHARRVGTYLRCGTCYDMGQRARRERDRAKRQAMAVEIHHG